MIRNARTFTKLFLFVFMMALLQGSAFAAGFSALVEAEDMTLAPSMVIGSDANAFGGKFIHVPVGQDTRDPVSLAEIEVAVPADGNYHLWARLNGPDGDSDAVYVTIGNAPWNRKWPSVTGEVYEWVKIVSVNLKKGSHVIKASHGEIRSRFDAFYLTDDANATPPATKP